MQDGCVSVDWPRLRMQKYAASLSHLFAFGSRETVCFLVISAPSVAPTGLSEL